MMEKGEEKNVASKKFVKYQNRKIHEEGSKKTYLSMVELGDIVAQGHDVAVVDDATGEDVTLLTLTRILYERCREGYLVTPDAVAALIATGRRPRTSKAA